MGIDSLSSSSLSFFMFPQRSKSFVLRNGIFDDWERVKRRRCSGARRGAESSGEEWKEDMIWNIRLHFFSLLFASPPPSSLLGLELSVGSVLKGRLSVYTLYINETGGREKEDSHTYIYRDIYTNFRMIIVCLFLFKLKKEVSLVLPQTDDCDCHFARLYIWILSYTCFDIKNNNIVENREKNKRNLTTFYINFFFLGLKLLFLRQANSFFSFFFLIL